MYWATGSLQNFGVIFLMLLTFYLLHVRPKYHLLAILLAGLALYSTGNGLYVLIFTTIYLVIRGSWKIRIFSLVYMGILLFLYFRNYQSPSYLSSPLTNIITRHEMVLEYFFSYFSGSIYLLGFYEKWFVLVLGILIFVLAFGYSSKPSNRIHLFYGYLILFVKCSFCCCFEIRYGLFASPCTQILGYPKIVIRHDWLCFLPSLEISHVYSIVFCCRHDWFFCFNLYR